MRQDEGLAPLVPSLTGRRTNRGYYNGFLMIIKSMFPCVLSMIAVDNCNFLV